MKTRRTYGWILAAVAVVAGLTIPIPLVDPTQYSAIATAINTLIVGIALALALTTYRSDVRARQVDRTLALHSELTSGELGDARSRLGTEVKRLAAGTYPISLGALPEAYETDAIHTPQHDANLLLRFFQRSWNAFSFESLEPILFAALVGRHATWWNLALSGDGDRFEDLSRLAAAADRLAAENSSQSVFAGWGEQRIKDFGNAVK